MTKVKNLKTLSVLIELPTWLGDSVMATPAIENIINHFGELKITLIGTNISTEVLKNHPKVTKIIILNTKYNPFFKKNRQLGVFDFYFTFRSSLRSKFLKILIKSNKKYQYDGSKYQNRHQVEKYVDFINDSLDINYPSNNLIIYRKSSKIKKSSKLIGINPGASYGSAKRWPPNEFAKVAFELSKKFDIIIFGGANEVNSANEIEKILINKSINNFLNLAGKTSITELIDYISSLDILITGDSGPMHIAASLKIPTIAIFGPTNHLETSQWMNSKSLIIKKNLDCQPCMKRTCPLKHNNCMKLIQAKEVIECIPKVIPRNI